MEIGFAPIGNSARSVLPNYSVIPYVQTVTQFACDNKMEETDGNDIWKALTGYNQWRYLLAIHSSELCLCGSQPARDALRPSRAG